MQLDCGALCFWGDGRAKSMPHLSHISDSTRDESSYPNFSLNETLCVGRTMTGPCWPSRYNRVSNEQAKQTQCDSGGGDRQTHTQSCVTHTYSCPWWLISRVRPPKLTQDISSHRCRVCRRRKPSRPTHNLELLCLDVVVDHAQKVTRKVLFFVDASVLRYELST